VAALFDLADVLDSSDREPEARGHAERALALVREHEIGGRVDADLMALSARIEVGDMQRRAEMLAAAEARMRAPGPGRSLATWSGMERIVAERAAGQAERAIAAADAVCLEELEWFGAPTESSFDALVQQTHAAIDLGDRARAEAPLERARATGAALALDDTQAECDWLTGRLLVLAGRPDEAEPILAAAQAGAARPQDRALVQTERALVLERLGRMSEARTEAAAALSTLGATDAFALRERSALEALLRRAGPYR
jgi:hypothetical protein